jgi:hypothetical protein
MAVYYYGLGLIVLDVFANRYQDLQCDLVELHAYLFMLYVIREFVFRYIVFMGYVFCSILLPIILNSLIYVFCMLCFVILILLHFCS